MAKFDPYIDTLLLHEGTKFVDNIYDRGGATKMGVTLATWVSLGYDIDKDGDIDVHDLKKITKEDVKKIAKRNYWDKIKGDQINSQSVAEFLFDWAYNSGTTRAAKKLQEALGVTQDGIIGNQTLTKLNNSNPKEVFDKLKKLRDSFYRAIARADASQKVFLKGWLARNDSFHFKA